MDEFYRNAEGPGSWYVLDPSTPKVPSVTRDLALEAFENGNAYSVRY